MWGWSCWVRNWGIESEDSVEWEENRIFDIFVSTKRNRWLELGELADYKNVIFCMGRLYKIGYTGGSKIRWVGNQET